MMLRLWKRFVRRLSGSLGSRAEAFRPVVQLRLQCIELVGLDVISVFNFFFFFFCLEFFNLWKMFSSQREFV